MGIPTLITTNTFSNATSAVFTTDIDSTYDEYWFLLATVHCNTDGENLLLNFSTDGGSNYNMTKTTIYVTSMHRELDNTTATLSYETSHDLAQSTSGQRVQADCSDSTDASVSGIVHLFTPSNTTYVKQFYGRSNQQGGDEGASNHYSADTWIAGYVNSTNDIDAVEFKPSGGNMDGTIQMYGIE